MCIYALLAWTRVPLQRTAARRCILKRLVAILQGREGASDSRHIVFAKVTRVGVARAYAQFLGQRLAAWPGYRYMRILSVPRKKDVIKWTAASTWWQAGPTVLFARSAQQAARLVLAEVAGQPIRIESAILYG